MLEISLGGMKGRSWGKTTPDVRICQIPRGTGIRCPPEVHPPLLAAVEGGREAAEGESSGPV